MTAKSTRKSTSPGKGDLPPPLTYIQPNRSERFVHSSLSDLGLHGGCWRMVHGENTDKPLAGLLTNTGVSISRASD